MKDHRVHLLCASAQAMQPLKIILSFLDQSFDTMTSLEAVEQALTAKSADASSEGCHSAAVIVDAASLNQYSSERLKAVSQSVPVLLFGAGTLPTSCGYMLGCIAEPIEQGPLMRLLHRCQTWSQHRLQLNHTAHFISQQPAQLPVTNMVGGSLVMQQIHTVIHQVAQKNVNVLITGESGTGKELAALSIHQNSTRASGPFVPINCGAIPPELLESELFGHEKGAFTGAIAARKGRFELAEGGTLFLDEIGDMPLPMQVKLLRVLQERCFERVGGSKSISTNVRVIAATHCNLEKAVHEGAFREDLYYRLNVFPIEMPALRQRTDDLPILFNTLVSRFSDQYQCRVQCTPEAMSVLQHYVWPGNVRELSNLVERLLVLFPNGIVAVEDLPASYRAHATTAQHPVSTARESTTNPILDLSVTDPITMPQGGIDLKQLLVNTESSLIKQALDDCDGVVARAATYLNMRRTTLVEKMRKYGIRRNETAVAEAV